MAPHGGYKKNTDHRAEYVRVDRDLDADSKITARAMSQTYEVWVADALIHHVYRCEQLQRQELYQLDQMEAARKNEPTVDPNLPKYRPTREKPTITRPAGQGSATSSRGPHARP